MSDGSDKKVDVKPDKTAIKALALGGLLGGGGECAVDVQTVRSSESDLFTTTGSMTANPSDRGKYHVMARNTNHSSNPSLRRSHWLTRKGLSRPTVSNIP